MGSDGGAIPAHLTVCRECEQKEPGKGLVVKTPAVPIVGDTLEQQQRRLMPIAEALQKHIVKKHPGTFQQIQDGAKQYMVFLGFSLFQSTDPLVLGAWNMVRHQIRKQTEHFNYTDEAIETNIKRLELDPEKHAECLKMFLDFRDVLLEQGKHSPLAGMNLDSMTQPSTPGQ